MIDLFNLPRCERCHGRGMVAKTGWEADDGGPLRIRQEVCPHCRGAGRMPDPFEQIQSRYSLNPDTQTLAQYAVTDLYTMMAMVEKWRQHWRKTVIALKGAQDSCSHESILACGPCQTLAQLMADPTP